MSQLRGVPAGGCGVVEQPGPMSSIASKCPQCGGTKILPIVYGLPGPELVEADARGEAVIGGCLVSEDSPHWCCTGCEYRWGSAKSPRGSRG